MLIGLMTAAANLVVGVFVGLCGVAGFLLPMFYTTVLEMPDTINAEKLSASPWETRISKTVV